MERATACRVNKRATDIDAEQAVIAGAGDLDDGRHVEQGGIVDEDIYAAAALFDFGYGAVDGRLVGHVEADGKGRRANGLCGLLGAGHVNVGDGNRRAFARIGSGKGCTNAARRAGDDGRFALQPHFRMAFPSPSKR